MGGVDACQASFSQDRNKRCSEYRSCHIVSRSKNMNDDYHLHNLFRYDRDLPKFRERVNETIQQSKDKLYDPPLMDDPHAIRYYEYS